MQLSLKFIIKPTKCQQQKIDQDINHARFVWNHSLAVAKESKWNLNQSSKNLTALMRDENYAWLKQGASTCLRQKQQDLNKAFNNFFAKRSKYPKFKRKHHLTQSVRYQDVKLLDDKIFISKIGWIKTKITQTNFGTPKMITITRRADKYYASFGYETAVAIRQPIYKIAALDLGLTTYATIVDSNGTTTEIENPRHLKQKEQRLKRYQRLLSRKQKGSNNRKKARYKLNKYHERVSNTRHDFQHKLSKKLTCDNQALVLENLNVKDMTKNKYLAKSIHDAGWNALVNKLKYKSELYGSQFIQVDRYFPSSKLCSNCGYKKTSLELKERSWACPTCDHLHNRDENAARNLLIEGMKTLYPEELGNLSLWSEVPLNLDFLNLSNYEETRINSVAI